MSDYVDRLALESAVNRDHPCDSSSCDIEMARDGGFAYVAADLLRGATETPTVDAVIAEMGESTFRTREKAEFGEWASWYRANTRQCPSCGTFVHLSSDVCGNCLTDLPAAA